MHVHEAIKIFPLYNRKGLCRLAAIKILIAE